MLTTSRVWLCFATAITISATAYLCAWLNSGNLQSHQYEVMLTRRSLELLREDIEAHKEKTGSWPAQLSDLKIVQEKRLPEDEAGNPVDMWGRPFQYRIEGDGFLLCSYGRDGQPGGVGLDADLYAGQPDPKIERPTLGQFTNSEEARPIQIICLLAGLFAFPLCLLQARRRPENPPSLFWFFLRIGVTAVFAILAALFMSALHAIPQGGH